MIDKNQDFSSPLKQSLLACKVMLKYVLIFGCVVNLLLLSTPIYSMQVLDRVLGSQNRNTLLMLTLVIMLALVLLHFIQGARSFAMNRMSMWFEKNLSEKVFRNSIRLSLESRANANSQALRDLQTIKTYITSPSLVSIMDLPWAMIFIVVLFILHVWIGSLAIIGGITLILLGVISDRATKPLIEGNNENFIKSMRQVDQAMRNAEIIEVMGLGKNIIGSWQKINTKVQDTQSLSTERQITFSEITKLTRTILQISVTGLGAYLVLKNEGFSSGAIIASSSLVGRALAPFEAAITSWKGFINCRKAYQRIEAGFIKMSQNANAMSLPEPDGRIDIENVYFGYLGSQKHLIKGVNFALQAGEMLAVLGQSGSGKSTLAKLIVGAYTPSIGAVRVDGSSMRDWNPQELGQYIGYLPQDVELFSGTVKENIARMAMNPDAEEVIVAAQLAGVHEIILQLQKGYNTEIGVDGSALSGGQKQMIGLARAFYGNVKILVLDEPNASLDDRGNTALLSALRVAKELGKTLIVIVHSKPEILNIADKVLIMNDGMMVAFGPKDEVMSKMNAAAAAASTNKAISVR